MLPWPLRYRAGRGARQTRTVPATFVVSTRAHSAGSAVATGATSRTAALLTSTLRPLNLSTARPAARSAAVSSVMSAARISSVASGCLFRMEAAAAASVSALWSTSSTVAPSALNSAAVTAPIPWPAPVTIALFAAILPVISAPFLSFELEPGVLDALPPARDFVAQKAGEPFRRAAVDRLDARLLEFPPDVRIAQLRRDLGGQLVHEP